MKAIHITCEPYHFSTILKCDMHKTINQHFKATVCGYTTDDQEEILKIVDRSDYFIIYANDNGERKSIFRGKVCNIKIRTEGRLKVLAIHAESNTCQLDQGIHMRTFQKLDFTYRDIVNYIVEKNKKTSVIYYAGKSEVVNGITVQYDESDWEFLKRLAARLNTVLVPDCTNDSVCFYFGLPIKNRESITPGDFEITVKCADKYSKRNIVEYHISSREVWDLCTPIIIQGQEVLIYSIHGSLDGGELIWQYRLRRADSFRTEEPYNKNMIGASLFGRVVDTKGDSVKLQLECEDITDNKGIWFPFATVYTSSDGNGWYFMPEQGERVRLCFPDEKEKNAYVSSSIYLEDEPGKKNNPDVKFIRTSHGKEIRLAPDYIILTNHKGMSIRLDDENGIEIKSSKNIEISSADRITLSSGGDCKIESDAGILMTQNDNSIMIREGICVNGVRVRFRQ